MASNNAYLDEYESPFYINSGKIPKYIGGKLDDITVIVAQVAHENTKGK